MRRISGKLACLVSEVRRAWIAVLISVVISLVLPLGLLRLGVDDLVGAYFSMIAAWTSFAAVHSLLTWLAFRHLEGEELRLVIGQAFREPGRLGRLMKVKFWKAVLIGGEGPSWSAQLATTALLGLVLLAATAGLRESPWMIALAVAMVAASWVNVWVTSAVQYARLDIASPGLEFAGGGPRSFGDYAYLSLMVQTTFGVTDVTITTRQLRRLMSSHGLISFVFNTVIVAMLVSLILGAK